MEFNFLTILYILIGIYLLIVAVRFFFLSVGAVIGFLAAGIVGLLLGAGVSWAMQHFLFPDVSWYKFVVPGAVVGWALWCIKKMGFVGFLKMFLELFWFSLKNAFLFKSNEGSSSSSKSGSGPSYRHSQNSSRVCSSCHHYNKSRLFCEYHNIFIGTTESVCDDWKY